jgi:hypothetical protein
MEAAGVALGVGGLITPCLDILDKAKTYRSFEADSRVLDVQFEAGRQWYKNWDIHLDDRLLSADLETRQVVENIQAEIRKIVDANSASQTRRAKGGLASNAALLTVDPTELSGQDWERLLDMLD